MENEITRLVIILDKSGSMSGLESDVVGGYNSLLDEQKKLEGEVKVTTILFDSAQKHLYDDLRIGETSKMSIEDYRPSGTTSLLDTIGLAMEEIVKIPQEERGHVIFSIMTDGKENSSKEYTYRLIKRLVEEKEKEGWVFLFQAANIDAFKEGENLGIKREDVMQFKQKEVNYCLENVGKSILQRRKERKKD